MRRLLRRVLFPVAAAALAATLFGCAKDDGDVTNPNPEVFKPKGIVQGLLTDSVTQQPIVGAVVDLGVGTATTNERGQFVIRDVPVNQSYAGLTRTAQSDGYGDAYMVTIDLRGVSSPVDMKAQGATKYPDFKYDEVWLSFSSLDDTEGSNAGGGSGSNHDTPVDNLVANMDVSVGKLSTSVKGCVIVASTNQLVANDAGYTVRLRSYGSDNSATGSNGRVLATASVVDGQYTFSNIEAMESFWVEAINAAGTMGGGQSFTTSVDGTTTDLTCTTGSCNALLVSSNDECAPFLLSTSVKNNEDLAPKADQTVVFTFSEAIKATPYAAAVTPSGAVNGGLYNDVLVTFEGDKLGDRAGNIAHTIAWTAANELTVTIAQTAVSSRYQVVLGETALTTLVDAANNHLTAGRNGTSYVELAANSGDPITVTVNFTTNGGQTAAAVTDLTVTDAARIDYDGDHGYAYLDWTPVVGAKTYNVYCAYEQLWADAANAHQFQLVDNVDGSDYELDFEDLTLVENGQIALQGLCYVVGVNSDGLEGPASDTVVIKDVVPPTVDSSVWVSDLTESADGTTATFRVDVDFSEPLDEAVAEDLANYDIQWNADAADPEAGLTILAADYDAEDYDVQLTVQVDTAAVEANAGNWTLTVDGLTDVAGNAMAEAFVYDNGIKVLQGVALANTAAQGQGVAVKANDTTSAYFNTILLYDGTADQWRLPATPYTANTGEGSVPRLTWSAMADDPATPLNEANATFVVYHYKKTLNDVAGMQYVDQNAVGHDTYFIGSSLNFEETSPWTSLQHFPVVHYFQVEAHLADSSVDNPGSYDVLARSAMIEVKDAVGPYVQSVSAFSPALALPANDGLAYEHTIDVTFSEPVVLAGLTNKANYAFSAAGTVVTTDLPMVVSKAEYIGTGHNQVRLTVTLTNPVTPTTGTLLANWVLTVNGIQDLSGNSILASGNQWAINLGAITATTPGARLTGSPAALDAAGLFNPF